MKGFLALSLALLAAYATAEEVKVKTGKGVVKGIREDAEGDAGKFYYAFKGIPYAQAPTGKLRFAAPVEAAAFEGEFDATDDGDVCPQHDISSGTEVGDEDCLNLNVFTPNPSDGKKRAVMVYVHGGAYIMGGGSSYSFGPDYLLENDVVIVTFNYRLGALGFLATEDKTSTGNFGVMDQIMALKWVKANVDKFGGDPDKVTLFGEDAGAASISLLAMAPAANGLFSGAITISGNALCDQYMNYNPDKSAKELAARLECSVDTGADIVDCLRRKTQQEIIAASQKMFTFFSFPRWFTPSVDGQVLPDTPENLMTAGKFSKVPFIVGQTKDEGAFFYRLTLNSFNNGQYDDNFVDHKLPRILPILSNFNTKLYPITRQVRKKYFVNVDMENEDEFRPKYVEFLTDLMYTRCTDKFAKILANHSVPTYEYQFDYRGQYSIVNLQGEEVDMGVAHGDDLQYIFAGLWGEELSMSKADKTFISGVMSPLLTNFAKTSVPTPTETMGVQWAPSTPTKSAVLRINNKLNMDENWKKEAVKFWSEEIPSLLNKKTKGAKVQQKQEL